MLLLIDNIDSFTHNLARYLIELGEEVQIVKNNEISLSQIEQLKPDRIVISPGPCTPNEAGISLEAIAHFAGKVPILGVCLGHQAIGQVFGASVVGAKHILHGKVSRLTHNNQGLFTGLPKHFSVTRYHSLVLNPKTLTDQLYCDAWVETQGPDGIVDREIMAISHNTYPVWGVQYHPESLLTEFGYEVLRNFLNKSRRTIND